MKLRSLSILRSPVSAGIFASFSIGLFLYWLWAGPDQLHIPDGRLCSPSVDIRTERAGRVNFLPWEEGEQVQKGDTLFSLDAKEEKEEQKRLEKTAEILHHTLSYYEACVEDATQEYISARSEIETGRAPQDRTEETLGALKESQMKRNECMTQVENAEKNLENNAQSIRQKTFSAPFFCDCHETAKTVRGLAFARRNGMYDLRPERETWVDALVPEKKIARISLGRKATVHLFTNPKRPRTGEVSWISPVAEPNGKGVRIKVRLKKNDREPLKPNAGADVDIQIR